MDHPFAGGQIRVTGCEKGDQCFLAALVQTGESLSNA
jgi:hypothetical protein